MNFYVVIISFMVGFCVNSIIVRLQGLKSCDDLIYPIVLLFIGIIALCLEFWAYKKGMI